MGGILVFLLTITASVEAREKEQEALAPPRASASSSASGSPDCGEWIETTAGWYGIRFEGRATASGEPFDRTALTAAHRTLPLGSEITVKNPENDTTVTVRVTDRGPYTGDRTIDLSQAAADAIGILGTSRARVKLCLHDADRGETVLQVSSFSSEANAITTRNRLRDEGYRSRVVHGENLYRVLVEVAPDRAVNEARDELETLGFPGTFPYRGSE